MQATGIGLLIAPDCINLELRLADDEIETQQTEDDNPERGIPRGP